MLDGPAFVKGAVVGPPRAGGPAVYADPTEGLYPCHSAAATWLSAAALYLDGDPVKAAASGVISRLDRFADIHGIRAEVAAVAVKAAAARQGVAEADLPDALFAFVGDGERHFPMRNPAEIRKAASYLVEHLREIPYATRRDMATRVLTRAADGDVTLAPAAADQLAKTAGHGLGVGADVAAALDRRVLASRAGPGKVSDTQAGLEKLAARVWADPRLIDRPGFAEALADVADEFDRRYSLTKSAAVPPIENVIYALAHADMRKAAAEHFQDSVGRTYRVADAAAIPFDSLVDALSPGAVGSDGFGLDLGTLREKAAAWSVEQAAEFAAVAGAHGVRPVDSPPTDEAARFAYLKAMAAA
jgi:hypothetical protein